VKDFAGAPPISEADEPVEITVGKLRVNLRRRDAWLGDQALKLTNAEFVILVTLMRAPGEVVVARGAHAHGTRPAVVARTIAASTRTSAICAASSATTPTPIPKS
jgi:hypothetical protein